MPHPNRSLSSSSCVFSWHPAKLGQIMRDMGWHGYISHRDGPRDGKKKEKGGAERASLSPSSSLFLRDACCPLEALSDLRGSAVVATGADG